MGLFSRRETTEETYQRTTVTPQQETRNADIARQVKASAKTGWRDRLTPAEQARGSAPYDENHPKHPRNR